MPHGCSHQSDDGCGHDGHNHTHDSTDVGPNDNLYPYIDRSNVVALNTMGEGSNIIKPWHERTNEDVVGWLAQA